MFQDLKQSEEKIEMTTFLPVKNACRIDTIDYSVAVYLWYKSKP